MKHRYTITPFNLFITFLAILFITFIQIKPVSAETYIYNVTDFGANGADTVDDTSAIQKALDEAADDYSIQVNIPAGTYYISKTLYIQSNTTLLLDSNATIYRSSSAFSKNMLRTTDSSHVATGYKGYSLAHDIYVSGGTWNGGDIANAKATSNLIYFGHSYNITLTNMNILNCYGAHAIEFAGIQNGTITNCNISGFRYDSDLFTSEAIQLDICYKSSGETWTPGFSLDKTVCNNIVIRNNTITDYPRGVGAHHVLKGYPSTNITIANNKFLRSSTATQGKCIVGVFLMGVSNVNITKNLMDHYYYGAMIKQSSGLSITKNSFKYNTSGNLVLESCDRANLKRKFTVTKDKIGKKNFQFTTAGITTGNIKTLGKTYKFKNKKNKVKIKLKKKLKKNQKITFYGKDVAGNKYYRTYYVTK